LIKLESPSLGTIDDTMMETSSDEYTVTPPESFISDSWTELNGADVDASVHGNLPRLEDLVDRCTNILERHILNVMEWREEKIGHLLNFSPNTPSAPHTVRHTGVQTRSVGTGHNGSNATFKGSSSHDSFVRLPPKAREELLHYTSVIASMYKTVLYHNFEHASHVVASTDMLLVMLNTKNRKSSQNHPNRRCSTNTSVSDLTSDFSTLSGSSADGADLSYGLTACPLTHLALVIAALVHDVEHQGVGNKQLVDENDPLAIKYKGKSVAENNSLSVALEMLEDPKYSNLYQSLFGPSDNLNKDARAELEHDERLFRRIFYDIILATDINSQERLQRNKEKWKMAFECDEDLEIDRSSCTCEKPNEAMSTNGHGTKQMQLSPNTNTDDEGNSSHSSGSSDSQLCLACSLAQDECFSRINYLRTSAILEQLIQTADVAHLMQSWNIFMKWNVKLYNELWAAKLAGRGPDVSANWFKGQIGFFDFYIIPLAKRLEHCGIFKSLGSLFVENCNENRRRWILEGEQRCRDMHAAIVQRLGDGN